MSEFKLLACVVASVALVAAMVIAFASCSKSAAPPPPAVDLAEPRSRLTAIELRLSALEVDVAYLRSVAGGGK